MRNFEELKDFIESHINDWQELLESAPYNLKYINESPYESGLWILVYNLFNSDLSNKIVKQTRGTVVKVENGKCDIVCAPYLKFFNYNDPLADSIDWDTAKVHEKIDGQLIKYSKFNNKGYWFTNGSFSLGVPLDFTDNEVHNFRELLLRALRKDDKSDYIVENVESETFNNDEYKRIEYESTKFIYESDWTRSIPNGWTLMFELTSKYNKIQVQYDEPKLWFHGVRDNEGNERTPEKVAKMFNIPYDIPKTFDIHTIEDVKILLDTFQEDKEGLVISDKNFNRIKCKSDVYLSMKFSKELTSKKSIWHMTINEEYDDLLPIKPELKPLIDKQIEEFDWFKKEFLVLYKEARVKFKELGEDKKKFAKWNKLDGSIRTYYFNSIKYPNFEIFYDRLIGKICAFQLNAGYKLYRELKDFLLAKEKSKLLVNLINIIYKFNNKRK